MAKDRKTADRFQSAQCADKLKALSDPLRLRIIDLLFQHPRNVSQLSEALDKEVVLVSHHLQTLFHAGLVEKQKEGRFIVYRLAAGVAAERQRPDVDAPEIDLGCCQLQIRQPE